MQGCAAPGTVISAGKGQCTVEGKKVLWSLSSSCAGKLPAVWVCCPHPASQGPQQGSALAGGRQNLPSPKEEHRHLDNSFIGEGCGDSLRYTQRNNYELNRIQIHIS